MSDGEVGADPSQRRCYLLAVACLLSLVLVLAGAVWGSDRAFLARHPAARDLPWCAIDGAAFAAEPDNRWFNDNIWLRNPALHYNGNALREGRLPAWNPLILAGVPYSANPLAAVYYPPNWLTAALPSADRILATAALHVLLAGLFVLIYLRALGVSATAALLGGTAFAFSGWVAAHLHNTQLVATVVWIPLGLWSIERTILAGRVTGGSAVAMAVTVAMMATAGFVQFAVLGCVGLGLYALASWLSRPRLRSLRHGGGLALAAAAGVVLAAPQVLTSLELLPRAARGARTVSDLQSEFYRPGAWVGLVLPRMLGDPMAATPWQSQGLTPVLLGEGPESVPPLVTNWSERTIYPGIVVLLLAGLSLVSARRRVVLSLCTVAVAGALMATSTTCIAIYGTIPGLGIGAPARAVMLLSFTLPALAACGFGVLVNGARERIGKWLLAGLTAFGVATGACAAGAHAAGCSVGLCTDLSVLAAVALALAALLWLRRREVIAMGSFATAVMLIALLDLLVYWIPVNLPVTKARLYPTTPALTFLAEHLGHDRYLRVSRDRAQAVADRPALFHCNQNMLYGLRDAQGYHALTPLSYLELWRSLASLWASVGFAGIAAADAGSTVLDVAAVRFLIAARPIAALADQQVYPALGDDGDLWIYRNPDSLPRARLVPSARVVDDAEALRLLRAGEVDARAEVLVDRLAATTAADAPLPDAASAVQWLRDEAEELAWQVTADAPSFLVVADTWDPGWQAWRVVEGGARERVPILRAMTCFRAVPVSRGSQRIEMVYRPWSVPAGFSITAATVVGGVVLLLLGRRRRTRR